MNTKTELEVQRILTVIKTSEDYSKSKRSRPIEPDNVIPNCCPVLMSLC